MIDPSSLSDAVAEQLRLLPTTMLELGEIAAVLIVGAVFSTSTVAVLDAVDPLVSVTVAEQVIVDPTSVSEELTM